MMVPATAVPPLPATSVGGPKLIRRLTRDESFPSTLSKLNFHISFLEIGTPQLNPRFCSMRDENVSDVTIGRVTLQTVLPNWGQVISSKPERCFNRETSGRMEDNGRRRQRRWFGDIGRGKPRLGQR